MLAAWTPNATLTHAALVLVETILTGIETTCIDLDDMVGR
jgi:hypothetical protein